MGTLSLYLLLFVKNLDWEKGQVQVDSEMHRTPRELEDLIGDLPWSQTETCSFAHKQHINILETKMIECTF